ncbi:MAG: PKD domain-containing protein [Bacteroidia bacterium]
MKHLSLSIAAVCLIAFSSCDSNEVKLCFKADNPYPKVNERVTFSAGCSENIQLYHWNFGDGKDTVTKTNTVDHRFEYEGYYEVTLHNTTEAMVDHCPPDGNGRVARASIEVQP